MEEEIIAPEVEEVIAESEATPEVVEESEETTETSEEVAEEETV